MNLRDHTLAWLDLIGADGLMMPNGMISVVKDHIGNINHFHADLVPAYRHADGSYHTDKEIGDEPCLKCGSYDGKWCHQLTACKAYHDWLAHKEATK
jgi:hypothetical protein